MGDSFAASGRPKVLSYSLQTLPHTYSDSQDYKAGFHSTPVLPNTSKTLSFGDNIPTKQVENVYGMEDHPQYEKQHSENQMLHSTKSNAMGGVFEDQSQYNAVAYQQRQPIDSYHRQVASQVASHHGSPNASYQTASPLHVYASSPESVGFIQNGVVTSPAGVNPSVPSIVIMAPRNTAGTVHWSTNPTGTDGQVSPQVHQLSPYQMPRDNVHSHDRNLNLANQYSTDSNPRISPSLTEFNNSGLIRQSLKSSFNKANCVSAPATYTSLPFNNPSAIYTNQPNNTCQSMPLFHTSSLSASASFNNMNTAQKHLFTSPLFNYNSNQIRCTSKPPTPHFSEPQYNGTAPFGNAPRVFSDSTFNPMMAKGFFNNPNNPTPTPFASRSVPLPEPFNNQYTPQMNGNYSASHPAQMDCYDALPAGRNFPSACPQPTQRNSNYPSQEFPQNGNVYLPSDSKSCVAKQLPYGMYPLYSDDKVPTFVAPISHYAEDGGNGVRPGDYNYTNNRHFDDKTEDRLRGVSNNYSPSLSPLSPHSKKCRGLCGGGKPPVQTFADASLSMRSAANGCDNPYSAVEDLDKSLYGNEKATGIYDDGKPNGIYDNDKPNGIYDNDKPTGEQIDLRGMSDTISQVTHCTKVENVEATVRFPRGGEGNFYTGPASPYNKHRRVACC